MKYQNVFCALLMSSRMVFPNIRHMVIFWWGLFRDQVNQYVRIKYYREGGNRILEIKYANYIACSRVRPPSIFPQSAGAVEYTDCFSAEGGKTSHNECPGYDTKQSDGEFPVMLELLGMWSTPLLPSLSGPLWPQVVVPDKGPIYGLNRTKSCFLHYTDFCI